MSEIASFKKMPDSFDYNDVLQSLQMYMTSVNEFKDVNWEGSAAVALLRVLAYNTQINQIGNSFIFNELSLDSATRRENVASIASSALSYLPSGKIGAEYLCKIVVTPDISPAPENIKLARTSSFFASIDGTALNFSPDGEYEASLGVDGKYTFNNVRLIQGVWVSNSFAVQTEFGIESYQLPNSNIDYRTISVGVLPSESATTFDTYTKVNDLFDLGAQNKRYFLRLNSNGYYTIEFGDDRVCRKLRFGEVVLVDYLITDGINGNGVKELSPVGDIGGFFDIELTGLQTQSSGGLDDETIDSIKRMAPLAAASQGSAVSSNDFVYMTKLLFPEADSVLSWGGEDNDPPKHGYQIVAVKAKSTDSLSKSQKSELVAKLSTRCVGSISPIIVDPEFTYIQVNTEILYSSGKTVLNEQSLRVKTIESLRQFSKDNLEFFGSDFIYTKLTNHISDIDGSFIGNVTRVSYEKRFVPILNTFGTCKINFKASLYPKSVSLSGFRITDNDFEGWTYSIVDNGSGFLVTQKVHPTKGTYTFDGFNGTVNYSTGELNINNFRPISLINSEYVFVNANPGDVDPSLFNSRQSINRITDINVVFKNRDRGSK